jgi:CheY-like chemotaxis protein
MSPSPRKKFTILVADDSEDDVLLMRRVFRLAKIAAQLQVVNDGEEVVDYLKGEGAFTDRLKFPLPALLLLDLKMPRRSGFEVLNWLREQATLKRLPVVVLTSSMAQADVNRAFDLSANSFLVKPSEFGDLVAMISRLEAYWLADNCLPDVYAQQTRGLS